MATSRALPIASSSRFPIGGLDGPSPTLHLVSISESAVDWERTDRYAQATRARQYAATQGEADFDALSTDVARALHDVATTKDPARRLALATDARPHAVGVAGGPSRLSRLRRRAACPRCSTTRSASLRVAAGLPRIDLTLVATASPLPPDVPRAAAADAAREHRAGVQGGVGHRGPSRARRPARGDRFRTAPRATAARRASWASLLHARASAALSRRSRPTGVTAISWRGQ